MPENLCSDKKKINALNSPESYLLWSYDILKRITENRLLYF